MDFPDHTRNEKEKKALARRKYIKWTLVCGKKSWQDLREMNVSISDGTLPALKREWVASCHFSLANCIVVNLLVFISQNERERKGQSPFRNTQIVDIKPQYFLSGREIFIGCYLNQIFSKVRVLSVKHYCITRSQFLS